MSDKIRVLHVIKSLGRGGAEMLLPETLRLHDKSKFEFHYIYFLPWKNQMVSAIEEVGGKVTCVQASNNVQVLLRTWSITKYVRDHKIDLIHAHLPWAGVVARIAGKISKVPVIYSEHNKQERYHILTRWMNLATMNWLTKLIAVSEDVARSVQLHKSNIKVPVQTILNGVNTERFDFNFSGSDDVRVQLNIPKNAPVVGTIAVFRFQKRLDLWLEISKSILDKNPEVHFVIVGDGPLKPELHKKWKDLKLERNVHFVGLQTEVRPYLALFDIYMMTSIFEGLPIALLEAMASGCAIISTNAGGIKELVRHEIDGLVCEVDNPNELIEYAVLLTKDTATLKQFSLNARKRVVEDFSLQKMVGELESVYQDTFMSSI